MGLFATYKFHALRRKNGQTTEFYIDIKYGPLPLIFVPVFVPVHKSYIKTGVGTGFFSS